MLTDDPVLVNKLIPQPALVCSQKKAAKKVPTEEDTIRANIESFGNDIGKITNRATTMYELMSHFPGGSHERAVLDYRIQCCQQLQQDSIDRAKGIISKPMPRCWYDRHAVAQIEDDADREFNHKICAERKPYFMRYIYPDLNRLWKNYVKRTNRNALREFKMTVDELQAMPYGELTDRQKDFLWYYDRYMPVGRGACVMNKICWMFEDAFDGFVGKVSSDSEFDYTILKSGVEYAPSVMTALKRIYTEYNNRLRNYIQFKKHERVDDDVVETTIAIIKDECKRQCYEACSSDKELCDALLDMCYQKSVTKAFVWNMCGKTIIENLLEKNGGVARIPVRDADGDIEFCGERFTVITKEIGGIQIEHSPE